MLRSGACFHPNYARRQLRKYLQQLRAAHGLAQHDLAVLVDAVHGEYELCQIESDGSNLHHASSSQRWDLYPLSNLAHPMPFELGEAIPFVRADKHQRDTILCL